MIKEIGSVELGSDAQFQLTTIVPLVDNPIRNEYLCDIEGLAELLEDLEETAEFPISIRVVTGA